MNILLTGGAGYIGSHVLVELYNAGHTAVVVDNLSVGKAEAVKRVEKIVNAQIPFYKVDLRDMDELKKVLSENQVDAVINFAGLKAVGESMEKPLEYYDDNMKSLINLLEAMRDFKINKLVFSSSASVYGDHPENLPFTEKDLVGSKLSSTYARTKWISEEMIKDYARVSKDFRACFLRYFNPIGAHPSGQIGEDPQGVPNNLFPFIAQVAIGKREFLNVWGDDYDTPDGTCLRDYIHIVDLAKAHILMLDKGLAINQETGADDDGNGDYMNGQIRAYNFSSGKGTSVLELIAYYEKACGKEIKYKIAPRRAGDISAIYANADKVKNELGWSPEYSIGDACRDSWRWQSQNPNGYSEDSTQPIPHQS